MPSPWQRWIFGTETAWSKEPDIYFLAFTGEFSNPSAKSGFLSYVLLVKALHKFNYYTCTLPQVAVE
jgi:hypothetical protein